MREIEVSVGQESPNRIAVTLAGAPVFIEADTGLAARIEAGLAAALLPALAGGATLVCRQPADTVFLANLHEIARIAAEWWRWRNRDPVRCEGAAGPAAAGGQAMFFTGGVDSFCTLLRRGREVEALINIHGFDIPLADRARQAAAGAGIDAVAQALSKRAVHVATDLRQHPLFNTLSWEITHVAALASVAHALSLQFGRVFLASSDVPPPWGSHPMLDGLWSSGALALVNDGAELSRLDKVRMIAGSDLVHWHLKVCWENRSAALNCGACEKCVRTQAQFAAVGALGRLGVFPPGDLAARRRGARHRGVTILLCPPGDIEIICDAQQVPIGSMLAFSQIR